MSRAGPATVGSTCCLPTEFRMANSPRFRERTRVWFGLVASLLYLGGWASRGSPPARAFERTAL